MTYPSSTSGFTMVELIAVIVLLSILALTALPRFINISDETHASIVEATAGALQTSVSLAHAKWRMHGKGAAVTDMVGYADGTWLFNASGFPVEGADRKSAGNSAPAPIPNHNRCGRIWNGLLDHNPPLDVSGLGTKNSGQHRYYYSIDDGKFIVSEAGSDACEYTYVEEPSYKIYYYFLTGVVTHTF